MNTPFSQKFFGWVILAILSFGLMSPQCNNNNTTDPPAQFNDYYIKIRPFTTPPQYFNYSNCQPFSLSSTFVTWDDLWIYNWPIEISIRTASNDNYWAIRYRGCQSNGQFNTSDVNNTPGTFPFTALGGTSLKIQAPSNRNFIISCRIYTMCGVCSTISNNTVSYSWQTPDKLLDPSQLVPNDFSQAIDIGQLSNEIFYSTTAVCPCN